MEENAMTTRDRYNLIANDIESHEFKENETGFLLSKKWYTRFKSAAKQNNNSNFNLPIDNSHLFTEDNEIKEYVIQGSDFIVVSNKSWDLLSKWYKITGPSREIIRARDPIKQKLVFDIPPKSYMINYLKPGDDSQNISSKQVFISKYATVADLKHKALKECGLYKENEPETDSRLRDYFNQNSRQVLDDKKTLLSYNLPYEPDLLLEKKNEQGNWTQFKSPRHISSRKNSQSNSGKVGLKNNINQCYQSSVIQALGHCRPLLDVIFDDKYDNVGSSKQILSLFRYYMKQMWNNETEIFLSLRRVIYNDREQHDAHEYLSILLNYLIGQTNPDPNIKEMVTPALKASDGTKLNDQETFKKNWDSLNINNQTPLFPMFYILSSNRYQCLECNEVTNVFEGFSTCEIPFDPLIKKQQTIIWIPYASSNHPLKFVIKNDNENATDDEFKKKINDVLKQNKVDAESGPNSTIAFAYSQNDSQTENSPTASMNPNLISGSSSTEILNFKPNFVFTNAKIVPGYLFAFEIPNKQKSYFLVNFPIPNFGQVLISTFICQFEDEESEEEAKRIAIEHLKKSLFGQLFKVEDGSNDLEKNIFINVTVSGSLVQDDRYQFLYKLVVNVQLNINDKINTKPRQLEEITKLPECDIADLLKEQSSTRIFDTLRRCDKCQKDTKCTISHHYWALPEVFVIHVVPYISVNNQRQRLPNKVTFPEILEINDSALETASNEKYKYKLFAVVIHLPYSEGGHFIAYAYHDKRKEWILFNDMDVRDAKLSDVLSADPFLLFYQRIHDE